LYWWKIWLNLAMDHSHFWLHHKIEGGVGGGKKQPLLVTKLFSKKVNLSLGSKVESWRVGATCWIFQKTVPRILLSRSSRPKFGPPAPAGQELFWSTSGSYLSAVLSCSIRWLFGGHLFRQHRYLIWGTKILVPGLCSQYTLEWAFFAGIFVCSQSGDQT
jgi:hypothetical protein